MIGAPAPEPCAGCGEKPKGERWDIVFYQWPDGRLIEKVRCAQSPECARAIDERFSNALQSLSG